MPKYTPAREQIEAKKVAKSFLSKGSSSAIARARGTTPQNESKKLRRKPVRDALQKYLDSPKLNKELIRVAKEGLEANRVISAVNTNKEANGASCDFIDVPDHNARFKFWNGLMMSKGKIKQNGNGKGVSFININYGYRKPQVREINVEEQQVL